MHNAQALLATTPFGVGGRDQETPGSPQTGNLGLFSTTPLALLRERPAVARGRGTKRLQKRREIGQTPARAHLGAMVSSPPRSGWFFAPTE